MSINEFKHENEALQAINPDERHLQLIKDDTSLLMAKMQNGKKFIVIGFVIAIIGILLYCIPTLSIELGYDNPVFSGAGLIAIGTGVICWITGAVKYLNAAIDSNSVEDSF